MNFFNDLFLFIFYLIVCQKLEQDEQPIQFTFFLTFGRKYLGQNNIFYFIDLVFIHGPSVFNVPFVGFFNKKKITQKQCWTD